MKYLIAFLLLATTFHLQAGEGSAGGTSTYYENHRYDFSFERTQIEKAPLWKDDVPFPPLSPRDAVANARKMLAKYFKDAPRWSVSSITLQPLSHSWMYIVSFGPPAPPGVADWMYVPFEIPVLLDGFVPTPVIKEHKM